MNVLVLGCGTIGSTIIRLLLKEKFVDEVYSSYVEVRGRKVLVNLKIIEFCLKAGVNYLDLACYGDYRKKIAEQLSLNKKFEKEKLVGLINAGISPGLTNLIVKENSEEFDYIESVKIRTLEEQRGLEFVLPWSREGLLDVASNPLIYRNYRFVIKKPFTEREVYEYPNPFGKMSCYLLSHDETYTIPHFLKVRNVDVKGGGGDIDILLALHKLGIFEEEKIRVGKFRISPKRFAYSIIKGTPTTRKFIKILDKKILEDAFLGIFVDCKGCLGKSKILVKTYTIFSQKVINKRLHGANYISYPTAISSAIFLKSIQKGKNCRGFYHQRRYLKQ